MSEKPREVLVRGPDGVLRWLKSCERARRAERPKWPLCSDGAGCHPDQRFEAMEHFEKSGCPTEFNELGQAVFNSHRHRRKHMKIANLYDKIGYC